MIGSLYAPDGTYIGPVPEWLTIPEARDHYSYVAIPVPIDHFTPWSPEGLTIDKMMVATMKFSVGDPHRNGAPRWRMLDQETMDAFLKLKDAAERWSR